MMAIALRINKQFVGSPYLIKSTPFRQYLSATRVFKVSLWSGYNHSHMRNFIV